jgi:hypothetical protein
MTNWAKPSDAKGAIDRAGGVLVDENADLAAQLQAYLIMDSWRSCHAFPLNTIKMNLRQLALRLSPDAVVAQRMKRAQSIILKLRRFPTMKLSQMQDLGGTRAILPTLADVIAARTALDRSRSKHELVREQDYIASPKPSGYRGVHRIYRYRTANQRQLDWDGLVVEAQIRTKLQHAWATAVETMGTFLNQSLKSSQGSAAWLRFFVLVSSAFAEVEQSPPVPGTPTGVELLANIHDIGLRLQVVRKLNQFRTALQLTSTLPRGVGDLFLLTLAADGKRLEVERIQDEASANARYQAVERQVLGSGADAVLVQAASLEALRLAYPNYFLDTQEFLRHLELIFRRARAARR